MFIPFEEIVKSFKLHLLCPTKTCYALLNFMPINTHTLCIFIIGYIDILNMYLYDKYTLSIIYEY